MSDGKDDKGSGGGGGDNGGGHGDSDIAHIKIDRNEFKVAQAALTGAQLRALPNPDVGADRDLFEVVPGGSDRKIDEIRGTQRSGIDGDTSTPTGSACSACAATAANGATYGGGIPLA